MNIVDLLNVHIANQPERSAIIDRQFGRDRVITFRQLNERVSAAVTQFRALGLKKGEKILSLLPVSAELYVLLLAAFRAQLVVTLPDPSAGLKRLAQICKSVEPEAIVYSAKGYALRVIASELNDIPLQLCTAQFFPLTHFLNLGGTRGSAESACGDASGTVDVKPCPGSGGDPAAAAIDDVPALLSFTSGSTGEPKAILRTQRFLAAQCRALTSCTVPEPGSVQMVSLPVFVLANIANGVTSVIPDANLKRPAAIQASPVVRQLEKYNCTELLASPAFVQKLVQHCLETGCTLSLVRKIFTGGAPVFCDLVEGASKVFPNAEFEIVYGSTEAEPIAHLPVSRISIHDHEMMRQGRGLLVGELAKGVKAMILAEDSNLQSRMTEAAVARVRAPDLTAGEILVAGDHVVKSYFLDGGGDAVSKVEVNGTVWHRTGDSGFFDERGRLWLLGRSSARVLSAHGTLYPFVVESVARMEPGVQVAALVSTGGGRRTLAVQCRRQDREAVKSNLAKLASRFSIGHIVCLDKLPVDGRHNSKVDYSALARVLHY
ncbi:MAG: AMP-binding protein [Candidatus Obscuribacterales bacterium]|nr:AMP-binding protein [Candidatus Obscuribacterales bacterium]